jgi:hypothetical protein
MDNPQRHEMILENNHPSGVQEWCCPTCGQCVLVTRAPRFMMVLRKAGNESALHTWGNYQQSRSEQIILTDNAWQEESEMLAPWIAWMEAVSFENLWNKKFE